MIDVRIGQVWEPYPDDLADGEFGEVVANDDDVALMRWSDGDETWCSHAQLQKYHRLRTAPAEKSGCDMGCDAGRGYRPGPHSHGCAMAGKATVKR